MVYVGMDVHKESYSLCCFAMGDGSFFGETKIDARPELVKKYLEEMSKSAAVGKEDAKFICAYEAGCLGFSLQKALAKLGIECKIIAPTTLAKAPGSNAKKTDRKDARMLARNLAYGTCSFVHIPDEEDQETREYIRMRCAHKRELKRIKQCILSFCLRNGHKYEGRTYWTGSHVSWMKGLPFAEALKDILLEYLDTYEKLTDKLERLDCELLRISDKPRYKEATDRLACLKGITKQSALTIVSEIGDFHRFAAPSGYCSYLGLAPGESSSGEKTARLGITKQGNSIVRTLLVESSQSIVRGARGHKSKRLKSRQLGQKADIISYADRAADRLMLKYDSLAARLVPHNKAIAAVARELACFIWGIMTGNTQERPQAKKRCAA